MKITLDNGEKRHAAHPKTFWIPDAVDRRSLRVGDLVKILFTSDKPIDGFTGERMWVEITARAQDLPVRYVGTLANEPSFLAMKFGDRVEFGAEHIIGIQRGGKAEAAS